MQHPVGIQMKDWESAWKQLSVSQQESPDKLWEYKPFKSAAKYGFQKALKEESRCCAASNIWYSEAAYERGHSLQLKKKTPIVS